MVQLTEQQNDALNLSVPEEKNGVQKTEDLSWKSRLKVSEKGKILLAREDAVEAMKEYVSDFWRQRILRIGVTGSRKSLQQQFACFQEYMESTRKGFTNDEHFQEFARIARRYGYREIIPDLWEEFNKDFMRDFTEWLKGAVNPPKLQEQKPTDQLEF